MAEEETKMETLLDLDDETLMKIGLKDVTFGASADAKIQIVQYESAGVWASMSMTFDFSALSGSMKVNDIVKKVVIPTRNSFVRFAHPETMSRIEELRALIEGVRDGKSYAEIERNVNNARNTLINTFSKTFEVRTTEEKKS
jgi:hypothetical protein